MSYMCNICGYTYEGDNFLKEAEDYQCPLCDSGKNEFQERNIQQEVTGATEEFFIKQTDK